MTAGSAQGGRSSALGRLVARAGRPAVRPREDFVRSHVVELDESDAVSAPGATAPARQVPTPLVQSVEPSLPPRRPAPAEVATPLALQPLVEADPALAQRLEPERDARPEATGAPPAIRVERHDPAPASVAAEPLVAEDLQLPPALPTWTSVEPAPQPTGNVPVAQLDSPGWQTFAEPEESDPPLRAEGERPRGVVAPARAWALEPEAPRPIMALAPPPPSVGEAARGQSTPATSVAVGPPQVLIDRIEVITPAARQPTPDPFLSLAARRVGASRHGGAA